VLDFLVCGAGRRAKCKNERWMHQTNCSLAFWCCCLYKETRRSTHTNNTRSSHARFEVNGGIFGNILWTITNLSFCLTIM